MERRLQRKAWDARYRQKHRFAIRLKNRIYRKLPHVRERLRGTRNEYLKEYYKKHREKFLKRTREWAVANREKRRLYSRRYKEKLKLRRSLREERMGVRYFNKSPWELCEELRIRKVPQLLYIKLRERYAVYGPEFEWADTEARRLLGIGKNTLLRARRCLRDRGLILYRSGNGRKKTGYTMLASALLTNEGVCRGAKMEPLRCQNGDPEVPAWPARAVTV